MRRKSPQALCLRHRRTPRTARDDERLADAWQRVLLPERRRCRETRAYARRHIERDTALRKRVHLFLDRAVDRRISRMQTDRRLPRVLRCLDNSEHLIKRHTRRIMDLRVLPAELQHPRAHERSRIDDDIRLP